MRAVRPLVSAIIPTYNRARDVRVAIETALAQTYPAGSLEVIVVDDGSTDGTAEALAAAYGDRIRVLSKPNGGVSSARNHGFRAARGAYLAMLDSDDEWLPSHVEEAVDFLEAHPGFGMVITDVVRMDGDRRDFEVFRRRDSIPEDGDVLRFVVRNPALVPASATLRREAWEDVGGFDETLRTAEDLDFHLRVAARWKIGVLERPLTRAMRGHEGLSALARTYRDYLTVIEGFLERNRDRIAPRDRAAALLRAYARNARGMLHAGDVAGSLRCALASVAQAREGRDALALGRLGLDLARGLAARARRALRREPPPRAAS
jgi:glycosyltransferase involved in cell wall biosynthesis